MPGQCRATEVTYTPPERTELRDASPILVRATFDIYLNGSEFCRKVEATVWAYNRVGREPLRKWLILRFVVILAPGNPPIPTLRAGPMASPR